jgi:hypothetical protein
VISRHATSPPLTETLLKQLKEHKHAFHEKEMELGENHEATLLISTAMCTRERKQGRVQGNLNTISTLICSLACSQEFCSESIPVRDKEDMEQWAEEPIMNRKEQQIPCTGSPISVGDTEKKSE